MKKNNPTCIYDANCRLCVSSKKWIERWDIKNNIQFIPFQSEEAKKKIPDIASLNRLDAMRVISPNGEISLGVSAFRTMLFFLPMGKIIALFFRLPGAFYFANKIYQVIAKNRYDWFGAEHEKTKP
ncbi:MAG: DUF393 domain-containing protein [Nitrospirota bacterium]